MVLPNVHDTPYLQGSIVSGHAFGSSKGLGTTGTVNQGLQKELAVLRLAPLDGYHGMAWIRDHCVPLNPSSRKHQDAEEGLRPSSSMQGLTGICL